MCKISICHRLSEKTITKAFGDLIYGDEDTNTIKELLDELNITKIDKKINDRILTQNLLYKLLLIY